MQAKRIQLGEANRTAGQQVTAVFTVPTDPREEVNFHNIWASVSVEPQDAGANCQGTWLLLINRENSTLPTFTDVVVNGETNNATIIACGVFSASNESTYNSGPIHPQSSRTLQPGDELTIVAVIKGITAGVASTRVMLCAHTTRK